MGLFDFFKRRRDRESAIPGGTSEPLTRQLKGDGKPIGQPVGQAFQSGNFQVTQGESQVIDLRGSGLRDEILGALQQHGIDPDAAPGAQINAGDVPGLQEQIMQALEDAGIDVSQLGNGSGGITIEGSDGGSGSADSGFSGGDSGGGDSGGGDSSDGDSGGGGGGGE